MRVLLILFTLLCSPAAYAGTITITITTASGACAGGACTQTYTDTDVNLARITPVYQSQCDIILKSSCSIRQVLKFWADNVVIGALIAAVRDNDRNTAVLPAPINPQ